MRWENERRSENVEDVGGMPARGVMVGGGIGTLLILVVALLLGVDPRPLLQNINRRQPVPAGEAQEKAPLSPEEARLLDFTKVVLALTEDVWTEQFRKLGLEYELPKLSRFSGQVQTEGCGFASAAVGPFYCPADRRVYLDLSFFEELRRKFRAPGEFAQAYVIAHEVGHHVQNLLGTSEKVSRAQRRVSKEQANDLSVRLELQADFFAGVWAHHAEAKRHILEEGDIESGLRAATAIGDDTLQKQAQGYVVPESFTHGSAEQRVRWFRKGLQTGDVNQGDTFSARDL